MKDKYINLERNKLKEIEKEFKDKGYDVIIRPGLFQLPVFLREIEAVPDLIAKSKKDNVVVEIKSRKSIKSDTQIAKLTEAVKSHKNWSFMLVYTNPKKKFQSVRKTESMDTIYSNLHFLERAFTESSMREEHSAYFLLLWSTFEATATRALETESVKIEPKSPASLVRDIAMAGLISRSTYEFLEKLQKKRNELAHGALSKQISKNEISNLLSVCKEILQPNES